MSEIDQFLGEVKNRYFSKFLNELGNKNFPILFVIFALNQYLISHYFPLHIIALDYYDKLSNTRSGLRRSELKFILVKNLKNEKQWSRFAAVK